MEAEHEKVNRESGEALIAYFEANQTEFKPFAALTKWQLEVYLKSDSHYSERAGEGIVFYFSNHDESFIGIRLVRVGGFIKKRHSYFPDLFKNNRLDLTAFFLLKFEEIEEALDRIKGKEYKTTALKDLMEFAKDKHIEMDWDGQQPELLTGEVAETVPLG